MKNSRRPSRDEGERKQVKSEKVGATKQSNVKVSSDTRGSEKPAVMAMSKEEQIRESEYERIKRDKEKQWANLRIKSRNGFRTYYDDVSALRFRL